MVVKADLASHALLTKHDLLSEAEQQRDAERTSLESIKKTKAADDELEKESGSAEERINSYVPFHNY